MRALLVLWDSKQDRSEQRIEVYHWKAVATGKEANR